MKITKTITRTYNLTDCVKWEMTATEIIRKRKEKSMSVKGLDKCFVCEKKFETDEYPYLALVKKHENMFVCKDCARKINKDRVED